MLQLLEYLRGIATVQHRVAIRTDRTEIVHRINDLLFPNLSQVAQVLPIRRIYEPLLRETGGTDG